MGVTPCELQQHMMPARILITACCYVKIKGNCLEAFSTIKFFSADVQRHMFQHPRHGKASILCAALPSSPYERRCLPRESSLLQRSEENPTYADLNHLAFNTSTVQARVLQTLQSHFQKVTWTSWNCLRSCFKSSVIKCDVGPRHEHSPL